MARVSDVTGEKAHPVGLCRPGYVGRLAATASHCLLPFKIEEQTDMRNKTLNTGLAAIAFLFLSLIAV